VGELPSNLSFASALDRANSEHEHTTEAEMALVTPFRRVGWIRVVRKRQLWRPGEPCQEQLHGHAYAVNLNVGTVAETILPHNLRDVPLRVLLTGPMSDSERVRLGKKFCRVRRERVRALLDFFVQHNSKLFAESDNMTELLLGLPDQFYLRQSRRGLRCGR